MKIFVQENIDVTRHRNIGMKPYHNIMTEFQNQVAEKAVETTQSTGKFEPFTDFTKCL